MYTNVTEQIEYGSLLLVTARQPRDTLYAELTSQGGDRLRAAGIQSVHRIGDCAAPATIAAAVYAGHEFARSVDARLLNAVPFRRERVALESD
jgi:dimethylamine/trimethylamine dehydrogenase